MIEGEKGGNMLVGNKEERERGRERESVRERERERERERKEGKSTIFNLSRTTQHQTVE